MATEENAAPLLLALGLGGLGLWSFIRYSSPEAEAQRGEQRRQAGIAQIQRDNPGLPTSVAVAIVSTNIERAKSEQQAREAQTRPYNPGGGMALPSGPGAPPPPAWGTPAAAAAPVVVPPVVVQVRAPATQPAAAQAPTAWRWGTPSQPAPPKQVVSVTAPAAPAPGPTGWRWGTPKQVVSVTAPAPAGPTQVRWGQPFTPAPHSAVLPPPQAISGDVRDHVFGGA